MRPQPVRLQWFGLFPFRSPLLREYHFDFFSSGYLDVSVPLLTPRVSRPGPPAYSGMGYPIRESSNKLARQLVEAYRSLATPFIGPWYLGIPRAPLVA